MMSLNPKYSLISISVLTLFLLSGCENKPGKDLEDYVAKLKQTSVKSDTAEAMKIRLEVEPAKSTYGSAARRSPFEVLDTTPAKGRVTTNPLQTYPLDMLRFVGTVTRNGTTVAFVSAPDNKIYLVREGDIIGDRDSQIISINEDRISLEEQYLSEDGSTKMKRVVTLQLKEASQ